MADLPEIQLPSPAEIDLRGYGLRLRTWRADDPGDVDAMLRAFIDPDFLHWNTPLVKLRTESDTVHFIRARAEAWRRGDAAHFCVTEDRAGTDSTGTGTGTSPSAGADGIRAHTADTDGRVILGHVGIGAINLRLRTGRVGYWVLPEARGRGIARHALELCTRWAFEQAGLHRIELGHALGHDASCRIAERCGYRFEGVSRDGMFDAGRMDAFRDAHQHARLSTDPTPFEVD